MGKGRLEWNTRPKGWDRSPLRGSILRTRTQLPMLRRSGKKTERRKSHRPVRRLLSMTQEVNAEGRGWGRNMGDIQI